MRLYRVQAISTAKQSIEPVKIREWAESIISIESCLALFETLTTKDPTTKMELLLLKGGYSLSSFSYFYSYASKTLIIL